jgi:serine/threonine-protein kinase RsbW
MRDKQSRTTHSMRDWVASLSGTAADVVAETGTDRPHLYARVVASATQLARVRARVGQWTAGLGMDHEQVRDVVLAIDEAVSNAVEHGYAGRAGMVTLFAACNEKSGDVQVIVSDNGAWRAPPADPGSRGRGLRMMKGLADKFDITKDRTGTTVVLGWHVLASLRPGCAA